MGVVLTVLLVQCVIAVVVIVILKVLLERELVEAALEKLQSLKVTPEQGPITITSAGVLKADIKARAQALLKRGAAGVDIIFAQDPVLKGGLLISFSGGRIDFTLADRLKNLFNA